MDAIPRENAEAVRMMELSRLDAMLFAHGRLPSIALEERLTQARLVDECGDPCKGLMLATE